MKKMFNYCCLKFLILLAYIKDTYRDDNGPEPRK